MKVALTEQGLLVGNYKCRTVVVYKSENGYKFEMLDVDGWTERREKKVRFGTKIIVVKLRKVVKSKQFQYSGIPLHECHIMSWENFSKYLHAINKKGEYINYYELKVTGGVATNAGHLPCPAPTAIPPVIKTKKEGIGDEG